MKSMFSIIQILLVAKLTEAGDLVCPESFHSRIDPQKKCLEAEKVGENTKYFINPVCESNKYCDIITGHCEILKSFFDYNYNLLGENCDNDFACFYGSVCNENKICEKIKPGIFESYGDCDLNQYFDFNNDECVPLLKETEKCKDEFECQLGLTCINDKCTQMFQLKENVSFRSLREGYKYACDYGLFPLYSSINSEYTCKKLYYYKDGQRTENEMVKVDADGFCYLHDGNKVIGKFFVGCSSFSDKNEAYCPLLNNSNKDYQKLYALLFDYSENVHTINRFEHVYKSKLKLEYYFSLLMKTRFKHIYHDVDNIVKYTLRMERQRLDPILDYMKNVEYIE